MLTNQKHIKTPVLLIAFNRYENTLAVFEQIRKVAPRRLYFAVDGPRVGKGEEPDVDKVKSIVKLIDWECDVKTLFREENLGCGRGPAEAISWAFKEEDCLIVLEDDCVPSLSFFSFCEEMLERYRDDERVNIISGRSHQSHSHFFKNQDYIFTHYAHTWGWATWKRVWNEFDLYMKDFPTWKAYGGAKNVLLSSYLAKRADTGYTKVYNRIEREVLHSWDSQWGYTRLKTGGLGIVPCRNLIHNIGNVGTHSNSISVDMPAEEMPTELRHPSFVVANYEYELYHYKRHIKAKSLLYRIFSKIKRVLT